MLADALDVHVGEPLPTPWLPASRRAAAAKAAATAAEPAVAVPRAAATAPATAAIAARPAATITAAPDRARRHECVGKHGNAEGHAACEQGCCDRSRDEPSDRRHDATGRRRADQSAQHSPQEAADDDEPEQDK